jgi:hypothetical protein
MLRRSITIALLAAAAAACSDSPTGPREATPPIFQPPEMHAYQGVLVAGSLIRTKEGRLISLVGWQTYLFGKLLGAEILVEGPMQEDPESAVAISEFQVLAFEDMPVIDGTLNANDEGYYIRSRQGKFELPEVPEELAHYLGRRVFVARLEGAIMHYGLLELDENAETK